MKHHTQALLCALAVTFALTLTLAVALICMTASQEAGEGPTATRSPGPVQTVSTAKKTTTVPQKVTTGKPPDVTDPPKRENTLSYAVTGKGESRVVGLGTCVDACVVIPQKDPDGNVVTSISPSAFYGCTTLVAVQIPETVTYIGEGAFSGCTGLMYLSVSRDNPSYRDVDGVLYSADGKTLILYPSMHAGESVHISREVTTVKEMAFYNCRYLQKVIYGGSAAEWERICIESKNYSLTAAAKIFGGDVST